VNTEKVAWAKAWEEFLAARRDVAVAGAANDEAAVDAATARMDEAMTTLREASAALDG
jgi:hypothetical protein